MSHCDLIACEIDDLDLLDEVCQSLGWTLNRDVSTFAWWGKSEGDYPIPEGYTAAEMGKCAHMISVPGAKYQIGVVPSKTTKGAFALLYDHWGSGGLTISRVGQGASKLVVPYAERRAMRAAKRSRRRLKSRNVLKDGTIELRFK